MNSCRRCQAHGLRPFTAAIVVVVLVLITVTAAIIGYRASARAPSIVGRWTLVLERWNRARVFFLWMCGCWQVVAIVGRSALYAPSEVSDDNTGDRREHARGWECEGKAKGCCVLAC